MSDIRFACPKCGQHLACDPVSQGTEIVCPACKQPILVVTERIRVCYRLLELEPGAPLNEVKQAHRERSKNWDRDRFPKDAIYLETAKEKTKELNDALETVTAYLAGTYAESLPKAARKPEGAKSPAENSRVESKPTSAVASQSAAQTPDPTARPWLRWILGGVAVLIVIALVVGLAGSLLNRKGPALNDESTGAHWVQADNQTKRAYCRAILIQMEREGVLRTYHVRVDDDFFYDGLQSILRHLKQEDLNTKLADLCGKLIVEKSAKR